MYSQYQTVHQCHANAFFYKARFSNIGVSPVFVRMRECCLCVNLNSRQAPNINAINNIAS